MNLEEQFKSLKSTLESKRQEQIQTEADIKAIDSQLADLESEAKQLGITDLSQLDTIISTKSQQLQTKLTELSNQLHVDNQPVVSESVQPQPVETEPVVSDTISEDMLSFSDFGV